MFVLIRLFLGVVLFIGIALVSRKIPVGKRRFFSIFSIFVLIACVTASMFIPFENAFTSFQSPESAYRYKHMNTSKIRLVVDGEYSSLVVGEKRDAYVYSVTPKTEDGWNVEVGSQIKEIELKICQDSIVRVWRFANTNDYYIVIVCMNQKEPEIKDNLGTTFHLLEQISGKSNEQVNTYFAYISDYNSSYRVYVDGINVLP